jgi:hypothetical protein
LGYRHVYLHRIIETNAHAELAGACETARERH